MSKTNKILVAAIIIALVLLLFKTCSKTNSSKSGIFIIPDDIAFVAALDLPQFLKKSQVQELSESDIMSQYLSDASSQNSVFTDIVKNPLESGIDFRQNTFYALDYDEKNRKQHFAGLVMSLKNSGDFENIVREHYSNKIKSGKGFQYVLIDKITIIGWSNDFVIFGSSDMFIGLKEKMEKFFVTDQSSSILNNEKFIAAIESGKDLSFWLSTTPFLNDKELLRSYGAADIPSEILKDNYITGYIDFGKGEMDGKIMFDFKEEMNEVFANYFNEKMETDFSKYLPKNNAGFVLTSTLNFPGIYNYKLGGREIQNAVDRLLIKKGITTQQMFRTFGGDVFLASYRSNLKEKASLVVGIKYFNRPLLEEFIELGVQSEYLIKESDDVFKWTSTSQDSSSFNITFPDGYPRLLIVDDILLFVTDLNYYYRILDGGYKRNEMMDKSIREQLKSNMVAGVFDMDIMTNTQNINEDIFEKCKFSFDKEKLEFELTFKHKEVYALKTLIEKGFDQ